MLAGRDLNISALVEPFAKEGFVTHFPLGQDSLSSMNNRLKRSAQTHCLDLLRSNCVWGSFIDTDEFWLPQDLQWAQGQSSENNGGLGQLRSVLELIDSSLGRSAVGYLVKWDLTYSEHRVLMSPESLLTQYPLSCRRSLPKVWFVVDRCAKPKDHYPVPHANFNESILVDDDFRQGMLVSRPILMVHYWSKSVEEFIIKKEESFVEYPRQLKSVKLCSGMQALPYSNKYVEVVQFIMKSTPNIPDAGEMVASRDYMTSKYNPTGSATDWSLYMFFKWAVSRRLEWDEQAFLEHPDNAEALEQLYKKYADGLDVFKAEGFLLGMVSCWRTQSNDSFCLSSG